MKAILKSFVAISALLVCIILPSCGGGGGGGGDDNTTRPKSLNGLSLNLDNGAFIMEFIRYADSATATTGGETGAIRVTGGGGSEEHMMLNDDIISVVYPDYTEHLTYKYTSINNVSGLLQVFSARSKYENQPDGLYYFLSNDTPSITNYFLTFENDGSVISNVIARVAPNTVPVTLTDEDFYLQRVNLDVTASVLDYEEVTYIDEDVRITLADGGPVPIGYSSDTDDENEEDNSISLNTLDGETVFFIPDDVLDTPFSATHTKTNEGESGTVTLFDENNVVQIGSGNYSYLQLAGTDDSRLIYSAGTGEDNTYILHFESIDGDNQRASGTYTISGGPDDGETGFFYLRENV